MIRSIVSFGAPLPTRRNDGWRPILRLTAKQAFGRDRGSLLLEDDDLSLELSPVRAGDVMESKDLGDSTWDQAESLCTVESLLMAFEVESIGRTRQRVCFGDVPMDSLASSLAGSPQAAHGKKQAHAPELSRADGL